MKKINIKLFFGAVILVLFSTACSNEILEEKPRSIFEPGFFKTQTGINGGLTALYAHTRFIYGQYFYSASQSGTDENTYAVNADNNFRDHDHSGVGSLTSTSSRSDVVWNVVFTNINTASGIIENASAAGFSEALISEARFFRAWDYFLLVQTFGGVPLDLGSGELKFNTRPSRVSVRNTVPEVYTKAIFPDLKIAIQNLPDAGRVTGGVTKTAARLYLAKAYLTYGWWLQNPNNIPTYPEAQRVDPDGKNAAWYFQEAYNVAVDAIKNPAGFGLLANYYDVNLGSNDRNREIVLYSDHIADELYNAASLSWSNGTAPENFAGWFTTWNYTELRSSVDGITYGTPSVQREAVQAHGRPWTRMCPTIGVIKNTFSDKINDSRYDGTFVTTYRGNWAKAGVANRTLFNANGLPVANGDAILTFLDEDNPAIVYPTGGGKNNIGAGELPGRADWVIGPSGISRIVYPGFWKLGPFRTDNGTGLGQPNGASTRPWNIAKFSELYFIAAEAAVKGANVQTGFTARELINVIRARAGRWRWNNNGNVAQVNDRSAEMVAATPQTIDINYILAERSREYFGEGKRWYDLVRTQKWVELATTYQICGTAKGDHTPVTVTRTIQPFHYLRPIPQSQLDALTMTDAEKLNYQNPGYR